MSHEGWIIKMTSKELTKEYDESIKRFVELLGKNVKTISE